MSVLEFISSLVGSLAWPAALIVLAFILRQPLGKMLTEKPLKTFEAGPSGVKLEYFDEKLEEALNELEEARTERPELPTEVPVPSPVEAATSDDFMEEMKQLAEVAPSAVILESFSRLERVMREALEREPGDGRAPRHPITARQLVHQAVKRGMLSPSEAAAFDDVAVLRNVVAHGGTTDLDAARALSYASLVRFLINSISSAQGEASNDGSAG